MDIFELQSEVENLLEETLKEGFESVSASKLGLDDRCGSLFIDKENQVIGVPKSRAQRLDYYGGFEYISAENKFELGEYVFYYQDERVENCFDSIEEANSTI